MSCMKSQVDTVECYGVTCRTTFIVYKYNIKTKSYSVHSSNCVQKNFEAFHSVQFCGLFNLFIPTKCTNMSITCNCLQLLLKCFCVCYYIFRETIVLPPQDIYAFSVL
jgi:hypothetical protein